MFQTGDKVAHPGHGGCTVSEICTQDRGGEQVEYLVLVPHNEPSVRVMVPVKNFERVGIREIITPEAADELLESFAVEQDGAVHEGNFAKRRQVYQDVLKEGSLGALAAMIQELMRQPKLNSGDKEMLPRAQRKLFSEIALAKGVEFERVMDMAEWRVHPENKSV